jgi:hypothetical protein
MTLVDSCTRDTMQVCRNGHVITDLLHTFPERAVSHCDRCGASTLDRCLTCGQEIPGAMYIPGAVPIGMPQAPQYCSGCGAAFPWTRRTPYPGSQDKLHVLETLLRKLPQVIRELRVRHGQRPAFRVEDEHDLEDLLRALLPLHFTDIRLESRTPRYASDTRTDFVLGASRLTVTAKRVTADTAAPQLEEQIREDIAYHAPNAPRALVIFIYDPESRLIQPAQLELTWAALAADLRVVPLIAS